MPTRFERANALRALAMDAVQRANSGHPGAPMGMADIAEVLWRDHLKHDPTTPEWADRDRFVLSNGHGSMLLYGLLHLTGYGVSLDDLKNFRQLHSPTAGHPEFGEAPGIETTTGPLGQGFANAVGMALAEKILAARYNRPDHEIVDHRTWVFAGDGCLMEGISHEAASLAGTHRLGKLICLYDDNGISIDGEVSGWFSDDTAARFEAYGWQVIRNVDGHDAEEIATALDTATRETERPTLVCCRTVIGFGSPNKGGTAGAHGAPLGEEEIARAREQLGWTHAPFEIPDDIRSEWDASRQGAQRVAEWTDRFEAWRGAYPDLAAEFERVMARTLPEGLDAELLAFARSSQAERVKIATRQASKAALDVIAPRLPELLGGSADLSGSNGTQFAGAKFVTPEDADGTYINWGVREFGMTAAINGIACTAVWCRTRAPSSCSRTTRATPCAFAALMGVQNILVYTHDSLALGEDGPTHQPVEQLATLRMTPGLENWRPADQVETIFAWRAALARTRAPTSLILSRQGLPCPERSDAQVVAIERGGYVLHDAEGAQAVLVATGFGSGARRRCRCRPRGSRHARARRLCSCLERFLEQGADYAEEVLTPALPRLVIEAAHPAPWWRLVGGKGDVLGVERFGMSAPGGTAMAEVGFTVENVVARVQALLG